jgi:hypothetical protein
VTLVAKTKLLVDYCSFNAAKYACKNWHYSGSMPAAKLVKFGVWENGKFIGAVVYARGANRNMLKPFGLQQDEGCELARVALTNHETPVTKIIALTLKLLQKHSSGLKLVVSYADARQGHLGIIYQAGNWLYMGSNKSTPMWLYHGKWTHNRTISSAIDNGSLSAEDAKKLETRDGGIRHKYLYPLDPSIRKQLKLQSKKYPKNMREEHESNALGYQSKEAGAIPSISHQKIKLKRGATNGKAATKNQQSKVQS